MADLSLSESLGGLRVTNPDDDETSNSVAQAVGSPSQSDESSSFRRPPLPSSQSSDDTITQPQQSGLLSNLPHTLSGPEGGGLDLNPDTYPLHNVADSPSSSQPSSSSSTPNTEALGRTQRLAHRTSMPFNYQQQQQMQYPSHSANYVPAIHNSGLQSASPRPSSGMYMQQNTSSSSGGSHRYREDLGTSADGNMTGLMRSGSTRAAMIPGQVPTRDGSRNYRATSQPAGNGVGPLPSRSHTNRMRAPSNGINSGYDAYGSTIVNQGQAEDWRERGAAVSTRQEADASGQVQTRLVKKGVKDFNFGRTLGEGSYSNVLAATDRQNLKEYAIKVLDKRHIIKEKKVKYVNIERDTLNRLTEHPGIVRLYYTFQDERSLYFVLDLATGGELLGVLKKVGSFDMECTRFYGAQILDSIAYMHSRGVIHRDLKPENVLLDRDMHTKITDFGTAKILPEPRVSSAGNDVLPGNPTDGQDSDRAVSFVGTAEYVSPELLRDKNACKASDIWAFGCIIYQLLAGRPPFKAANEYLTFQKILSLEYVFPDGFPPVARDLVERLLVLDPGSRLPIEHIKNHEFFQGMQWGNGLWRQKAPRLKPYVPPPAEPIKLNGAPGGNAAFASSGPGSTPHAPMNNGPHRPRLRGVTELPPPSQLDIDWSPILSNNERILKLGNLTVYTGSQPQSPSAKNGEPATPSEKPKLSRLFGGNASKKRERLVLITSSARLLIAAAGGNEKKAKMQVDCLVSGTTWKTYVDSKGLTAWQLDTREKHLTFEDPRATTSDPAGSKYNAQEWIDSLDQAREIAITQSMTGSYSGDSLMNTVTSDLSSPAESLGGDSAMPLSGSSANDRHAMRHTLRKTGTDEENSKGRKRFSKRHSKSGLAAVF